MSNMAPLESGSNDTYDAFARIASQDTRHIYALLTGQVISPAIYELMISQLGNYCGAPGPAFMPLTQRGVELMRAYPDLSFSQQLLWIRTDLRLREEILIRDQGEICSRYKHYNPELDTQFDAIIRRM